MVSKSFILLEKSFLGTFIDIWRLFIGHTVSWRDAVTWQRCSTTSWKLDPAIGSYLSRPALDPTLAGLLLMASSTLSMKKLFHL